MSDFNLTGIWAAIVNMGGSNNRLVLKPCDLQKSRSTMEMRSSRTKCEGNAELGCPGKGQEVTLEERGLVRVRRGKLFQEERNHQPL